MVVADDVDFSEAGRMWSSCHSIFACSGDERLVNSLESVGCLEGKRLHDD